ncbi:MAG: hypothetical protein K2M06_08180 [Muribaculaceae bacterium]|nr:hypothetical protein [Muribaculaceae bacterium]
MNEDKTSAAVQSATSAPATDTSGEQKKSGWLPLAALLLAILAWLTLAYSTGYAAMAVAAAAIIVAAFGARRHSGAWRNVAITAIIASAVLLVVVAAFIIVLKIGLA